jgi:hypothetical protein
VSPAPTTAGPVQRASGVAWFSADGALVWGSTALALAAAALLQIAPRLLALLVFLDIFILGYPHVVATFTRIAWDPADRRRFRLLLTGIPMLVLLAIGTTTWLRGVSAVLTVYLYVQWFHYTRQSYGIYKALQKKASPKSTPAGQGTLAYVLLYAAGVAGILVRSHQRQPEFLGLRVF